MSCSICGRGSCTRSFHSIAEQELFDDLDSMSERELKEEIGSLREQVDALKQEVATLESKDEENQS